MWINIWGGELATIFLYLACGHCDSHIIFVIDVFVIHNSYRNCSCCCWFHVEPRTTFIMHIGSQWMTMFGTYLEVMLLVLFFQSHHVFFSLAYSRSDKSRFAYLIKCTFHLNADNLKNTYQLFLAYQIN